MTDPVVRLAVTNPEKLLEILSHQEMAAQEFEPVPQLRGQKAKTFEELKKHQERLDDFCISVRMPLGVLGRTKAELIGDLTALDKENGFDAVEGFVTSFAKAADHAVETSIHFLRSAGLRLTVAMHNVYPDDGSPEGRA
jgi:hypothetical protein